MNTTEKFKKSLKDLRKQLQDKLVEYKDKKSEINRKTFEQKKEVSRNCLEIPSKTFKPMSQIVDEILGRDIAQENDALMDEYHKIEKEEHAISRLIAVLNLVINNFSVESANRYISLSGIIETLYYSYGLGHITLEDVGIIIGLTVEAGRKFLSKSKNNTLSNGEYSITLLQDYFAKDGSFKYNERTDKFKTEIERLETVPDTFRTMLKAVAGIEYEVTVQSREVEKTSF